MSRPVAVVVNESREAVDRIMRESGCHLAQVHGHEPPEFLESLGWPAVKGVSVARPEDLAVVERYRCARAILLDTKVDGQFGGTGRTFDWTIARSARRFGRPIILAGGLGPDNVAEAIRVAEPDAIDVSSGVERAPGCKDPELLRRLFREVEEAREWPSPPQPADRR